MRIAAVTNIDFGDLLVRAGEEADIDDAQAEALVAAGAAAPAAAPPAPAGPQLTDIAGIGKAAARRLAGAGVGDPAALAALPDDGLDVLGGSDAQKAKVAGWRDEARALVESA